MDRKRTSETTSSSGGKKDENFLTKTAHSIRDKVHELTDDVKEKTHNLTHSGDSKKNKKDKNQKKTDTKLKTSSKPPTAGKKDSGSESDDEDESPKPPLPPSVSAAKKDNERTTSKPNTLASKPSATSTSSTSSDKLTSKDSTSKSSDEHKNTAAAPRSSAKSSGDNLAAKSSGPPSNNGSKPSTDKPDKAAGSDDRTNKSPPTANNKDQVHVSFDGVATVDDLLDRIDEAVEKAKLIVENGEGTISANAERTSSAPTPSLADLERKPVRGVKNDKNKEDNNNEEEPIRIDYKEIHKIEDLIVKINEQPGHRKVVLENTPNDSGSVTAQNQPNPPRSVPLTPANSEENDDSSGPPKSILKTSQDPSSLDTSTKVSSFQDDQIHVNIEGVQGVDELTDRIINDAVHSVPAILDAKTQGEKRQAPQAPNQTDNNNELPARTSSSNQKREAPKAPSSTNESNNYNENIVVSQFSNFSLISANEEKKDASETSDWI